MHPAQRSLQRCLSACLMTCGLAACTHVSAPPSNIIATFEGGTISQADYNGWLAFMKIPPGEADPVAECEDIALLESLAADVTKQGVDPSTAESIDSAVNTLLLRRLHRHVIDTVEVSPGEIEDAYSKYPDAFHKPHRLRLRNLFLSYPPDATAADKKAVRRHMEDLLTRLDGGADFGELARAESHSQTRFSGGLMGNVAPGTLPPAVDSLVMSLQPGEFSSILETPDGLTVFYCEKAIEARSPTPDEVRGKLAANIRRIKQKAAWAALKGDVTGDPETPDAAFTQAAAVRARGLGLDKDPETSALIVWKTRQILATEALRRRLESVFKPPTEDEVRTFFESDPSPYRTPETFEISVIRLTPAAGDAESAARQARVLAYRLRRAESGFSDAARSLSDDTSASNGGRLESMTRQQMAGRGPEFMKSVVGLQPGAVSREFMADGAWWIVRLVSRHAPRQMTFDQASEQARRELTKERMAALQDRVEMEIRLGLQVVVTG